VGGGRKLSRQEWLSSSTLIKLVPDLIERVVYLCGPLGMQEAVIESLLALGMARNQIRTEVFRLK
jgi:ferredoxin-NADP reductase